MIYIVVKELKNVVIETLKPSRVLLFTIILLSAITLSIPFSRAAVGMGTLYVYSEPGYETRVHQDEHDFYEVSSGYTVFIKIGDIQEFEPGKTILITIRWNDYTMQTGYLSVLVDRSVRFPWRFGDFALGYQPIPPGEIVTVYYRGDTGPEYVAIGGISSVANSTEGIPPSVAMDSSAVVPEPIHVTPENPLGTLGTISALFLGLTLYLMTKGKPQIFHTQIKIL